MISVCTVASTCVQCVCTGVQVYSDQVVVWDPGPGPGESRKYSWLPRASTGPATKPGDLISPA